MPNVPTQNQGNDDSKAQKAPKRPLTWQEKIDAGQPLNPLDETKADADFNHKKRVRDQDEREQYEARKRGQSRQNPDGDSDPEE